jgi:hypothetical protein
MLTLTGIVKNAIQIPAGTNRKTGEIIPARCVVQFEVKDRRGLDQLVNLTVPDHRPYEALIGKEGTVPVYAYAPGASVSFVLAQ